MYRSLLVEKAKYGFYTKQKFLFGTVLYQACKVQLCIGYTHQVCKKGNNRWTHQMYLSIFFWTSDGDVINILRSLYDLMLVLSMNLALQQSFQTYTCPVHNITCNLLHFSYDEDEIVAYRRCSLKYRTLVNLTFCTQNDFLSST